MSFVLGQTDSLSISNDSSSTARPIVSPTVVMGGHVYTLLFDLFAPDSPTTKEYEAIVEKLKSHFKPKPTNVLSHCYTFHQRNQDPNESVAEYEAELMFLASPCTFGTFLEQALCGRVMFGIRSESIHK